MPLSSSISSRTWLRRESGGRLLLNTDMPARAAARAEQSKINNSIPLDMGRTPGLILAPAAFAGADAPVTARRP